MNKAELYVRIAILEKWLRGELPIWAAKHFERVLNNDETPDDLTDPKGACGSYLVWAAKNETRGAIATWLYYRYRAGVTVQSIYRQALNDAWNHDHHHVLGFVRNNRWLLKSMFQHAGFESPAHLPDTLDIWRGTAGLGLARASHGISWTLDRKTACWFCSRMSFFDDLLVLRASVSKAEVFALPNDRDEREVIWFGGSPENVKIDGNIQDWHLRAKELVSERKPLDICIAGQH